MPSRRLCDRAQGGRAQKPQRPKSRDIRKGNHEKDVDGIHPKTMSVDKCLNDLMEELNLPVSLEQR